MADARLWYVPVSGGSTETVTWSADPIQGWQDIHTRVSAMPRAAQGYGNSVNYDAPLRAQIGQARMGSRSQAMALRNAQTHLETGGVCGISADSDKAFLAYTSIAPARGDTVLTLGARQGWNASATMAAGDYLTIESSLPWGYRETHEIDTYTSATSITLSTSVVHDYSAVIAGGGAVWVRWVRYLPFAVWPTDARRRPLVLSMDGQQFVWDFFVELELDRPSMDAANPGQGITGPLINSTAFGMPLRPDEARVRKSGADSLQGPLTTPTGGL